jgi:hypothetical protein
MEQVKKIRRNLAYGFVKKCKKLTTSNPKELDASRILASTWENILPFFEKLDYLFKNRNYLPEFVLNFDEVSLSSTSSKSQIHVTIADSFINSTPPPLSLNKSSIFFTVSSGGSSFPSIVLLPQKSVPEEFVEDENIRFLCSSNGWMTRETLENIFEKILIPAINSKRKISGNDNSPVLIITDGHNSRCSGKIFSMCIMENIDMICLPAHTSHIIQPLDRGINRNFKNPITLYKNYNSISSEKENRIVFFEFLKKSISHALTYDIIKDAWDSAGLYPFNPYKINQYFLQNT